MQEAVKDREIIGGPMSKRDEDEEAADWAWARKYASESPRWSDAKWQRMNAALRINVVSRESHPSSEDHRR